MIDNHQLQIEASMGLRFRKSFELAPGVRLNVSNSGTSWSIGPRGATVSIGKRGTYLNAGLPGTGISTRVPLGRTTTSTRLAAAAPPQPVTVTSSLTLKVGDDGTVQYLGSDGHPVSSDMIAQARRQHGDTIRDLLERKCSQINADITALAELHWYTPAPRRPAPFVPVPFEGTPPTPPTPLVLSLADRLLPGRRQAAEAAYTRQETSFRHVSAIYESDKGAHEARNIQERMEYSAAIAGNPDSMQRLLERRLSEIVWPKETQVDFDVEEDGAGLKLDVDLPEIEHMPTKRATVATRGWDLTLKDVGEQATRKLYQQHIHAL